MKGERSKERFVKSTESGLPSLITMFAGCKFRIGNEIASANVGITVKWYSRKVRMEFCSVLVTP